MSFFFSEKKRELANKPVSTKLTRANKSSKETLNRLGCQVCPLNKVNNTTPKMPPKLADETDVYILGDKPTEDDDDNGKHFTANIGKLLKPLLDSSVRFSFDNTVRDYDHYKTDPSWVAMECCRGLVTQSIERAKPRVLLGLGVQALQWVMNSSDMIGLRGRIFAVKIGNHSCYFIPTYHPSDVFEHAFDKNNPLRSQLGHCLKFDIKRAVNVARTLPPPQIDTPQAVRAALQTFNGTGATHLAQVKRLMGEAIKAPTKAIDLETSTLRPYADKAAILTVAVSYDDINFSFALDHPKAGWKPNEKKELISLIVELLTTEAKIIAHNTPFEVEWLISLVGKDNIFHHMWECTMMQSHFLDERRGKRGGNDEQFQPNPYQALDFLVKQYFGISYKPLFKLDRKNMAAADLDETLLYNAADTKYTLRLYALQKKLLQQSGLLKAYREAQLRQPTVALMQHMGIDVDQSQNKKMADKLGKEIKEIEDKIFDLDEVKAYIKDHREFNPASGPDLIRIFKDYIKVGDLLKNADGKESTDKGILANIPHSLAGLVESHRNRSKLKSTYVDVFTYGKGEFIWRDAKIHPSFNTTFSETGRTSSDEPNQQNWPKRNDAWVRRQIVAPNGHVLVAFDYGQLEACTAAMCTRDSVLVESLWNDYDIHMEWAYKAAEIYPDFVGGRENIKDKGIMKKFRSLIKNKLVFPVIFGASTKSVGGYLRLATGTETPQAKVDKLMDEFWKTFHGLAKWQKDLMNDYYELGYVASPTGRRRHYPLTKNQAVNYPIQSVACDIVCRSMVNLSCRAADTGKWWLQPIMNIHDDLTFCIPDKPQILEEAIETIYRTMLDHNYPFINVPLSVSGSIGKNWLDMDESVIGKFTSDKDL